ncbi:MAG TPA: AmmeMemoRadiSam system protein A [Propionicimonas sp.]|nr:AmmeMemoRadiSam system protein A [Propionicimonas sp.]
MSAEADGPTLLALARGAIAARLPGAAGGIGGVAASGTAVDDSAAWLGAPGAAFVTLTEDGSLRGCIGSVQACRPLRDDVRHNARAAAFADPRFPPLRADELSRVRIEVSLLSAPEPLEFTSRADALAQLRPGVDGVVLSHGRHRGVFLPQVWEQLPAPERFLERLLAKAGLPPGWWDAGVRLERFTVTAWQEPEP